LIEGWVARLRPAVDWVAGEAVAGRPALSGILRERVGYFRIGSWDAAGLEALDGVLGDWAGRKLGGAVLDLREAPASDDFEAAAEVVRRFAPKGIPLFTVVGRGGGDPRLFTANRDPGFAGRLAVLIAPEVAGAGEVVAEAMRVHAGALLVGERTAGAPFVFERAQVGGRTARFAVGEVKVSGSASLRAVAPDVAVPVAAAARAEILAAGRERGIESVVAEKERPRMNEAALVSGSNPLIELLRPENAAEKKRPALDGVLVRALDIVQAAGVFVPVR
jgi:C-terminal processing protease CtpA/Prc